MPTSSRRSPRSRRGACHVIWLVRHGETEWSRDGRHTGSTDVPLTDRGREQARAARVALGDRRFAVVLCSPLVRARETAALLGVDADVRDDLRELDYGRAEGRTTAELREERPGWSLWNDGPPGGETVEHAGMRADRILAEARAAGGDVLLVAHGHLLRILAARWLEQPAAFGARLRLDTATVSVLGHERETPVLLRWNTR